MGTMKTKPPSSATKVAARFLKAMAYKREEYKNKIQSHLTGAIVEFYKARLATKNGQIRWVDHWMSEVRSLIEHKLVYEILHVIRGFKDRRKAYNEAIAELRAGDRSYRKYADTTIKKDFRLTKLKHALDDTDTDAFWEYVDKFAGSALESTE